MSRAPVLPPALKVLRWVMGITSLLDGVFSVALFIGGVWIVYSSAGGIESARQREEFAAGMMAGGVAWIAWFCAAILAVLSFACWRAYVRVGRSGTAGFIDFLTEFLALLPVSVGIAIVLRS